jgi:hypothetical protein
MRLAIALALALGWVLIDKYSVEPADRSWLVPVERVLRAALATDSTALANADIAPHVQAWAMRAGRTDTALLHALLDAPSVTAVRVAEGQTLVLYSSKGFGSCSAAPLAVTFEGSLASARISDLTAECRPRTR